MIDSVYSPAVGHHYSGSRQLEHQYLPVSHSLRADWRKIAVPNEAISDTISFFNLTVSVAMCSIRGRIDQSKSKRCSRRARRTWRRCGREMRSRSCWMFMGTWDDEGGAHHYRRYRILWNVCRYPNIHDHWTVKVEWQRSE